MSYLDRIFILVISLILIDMGYLYILSKIISYTEIKIYRYKIKKSITIKDFVINFMIFIFIDVILIEIILFSLSYFKNIDHELKWYYILIPLLSTILYFYDKIVTIPYKNNYLKSIYDNITDEEIQSYEREKNINNILR